MQGKKPTQLRRRVMNVKPLGTTKLGLPERIDNLLRELGYDPDNLPLLTEEQIADLRAKGVKI